MEKLTGEGRKGPEYSPLISPPLGDEEGVVHAST